MADKPTDSQQVSAKLAEAVMWMMFAFVAILALAVAIRIGLWIVGVAG